MISRVVIFLALLFFVLPASAGLQYPPPQATNSFVVAGANFIGSQTGPLLTVTSVLGAGIIQAGGSVVWPGGTTETISAFGSGGGTGNGGTGTYAVSTANSIPSGTQFLMTPPNFTYAPTPGMKTLTISGCGYAGPGGSGGVTNSLATSAAGGGGGGGADCHGPRTFTAAIVGTGFTITFGSLPIAGVGVSSTVAAGNNGTAGGNITVGALDEYFPGGAGAQGNTGATNSGGGAGGGQVGAGGSSTSGTGGTTGSNGGTAGGSGAAGGSATGLGGAGGGGDTVGAIGNGGGNGPNGSPGGAGGGGINAGAGTNGNVGGASPGCLTPPNKGTTGSPNGSSLASSAPNLPGCPGGSGAGVAASVGGIAGMGSSGAPGSGGGACYVLTTGCKSGDGSEPGAPFVSLTENF